MIKPGSSILSKIVKIDLLGITIKTEDPNTIITSQKFDPDSYSTVG